MIFYFFSSETEGKAEEKTEVEGGCRGPEQPWRLRARVQQLGGFQLLWVTKQGSEGQILYLLAGSNFLLQQPQNAKSRKDLLAILSQKNTRDETEFLKKLIK